MNNGSNTEITRYNPSAIIHLFNNALIAEAAKKLLHVKGKHVAGRGNNYNGYYYDSLKDETSDTTITLIVPAIMRTGLINGQTIECGAYLTKKVQLIGARIELQLNIVELISQTESTYTADQLKVLNCCICSRYFDWKGL